jgi:hypothetical protein
LSQGIRPKGILEIFPLDVIDRRCAPARRIRVLVWRMRQLVGRDSASAEKVLRGACLLLLFRGRDASVCWAGQGHDGTCCSAAGVIAALSRTQGLSPAFPGRLAARPSGVVGHRQCCAAQRPGARLCVVWSCLDTVTEGIFRSWSAAPSRAVQTFSLRQA